MEYTHVHVGVGIIDHSLQSHRRLLQLSTSLVLLHTDDSRAHSHSQRLAVLSAPTFVLFLDCVIIYSSGSVTSGSRVGGFCITSSRASVLACSLSGTKLGLRAVSHLECCTRAKHDYSLMAYLIYL